MSAEDFKRKLTAVLSADVAGYSRLMAEDEAATVKTIATYREVMASLIKQHRGRVVDSPGDNVLAEFASVVDAVQCAVAVQKEFQARNAELPENRRMEFRIGINLGDVIEEEARIYGDGVNIAARLEALADPGGICVSKTAFDHIESKLPLGYEYLGEQPVKNIPKPVGAYRVLMEPRVTVAEEIEKVKAVPVWQRKTIMAAGVVLVLVVIAALIWNFYLRPPPIEPASLKNMAYPLPDKPSIAVLPFENLSDDPKQEYLSDGISEAIISALSKVPRLFVIARNSSFTYKGKPVKVQQVAEELGVQYVLEGSVQRSGQKLRVAAQLVDALKGHHLWSERYDFKMDDLLAVQDKIALNVLVETQVKLTEGEQARLLRKETNNLKAYEKYLEASMYYYRVNREDMFKARQLFEEAIRLDPEFSSAYRMVAGCHIWELYRGWSKDPEKSWELGVEFAQKALALDENNSGNLMLLSGIHERKGDHEKAVEIARRAVETNPNHAGYIEGLAGRLFNAGRYEEAIPLHEKAGRLNPFPPARYFRNLGLYYWFTGRYGEAITASKKALHINPDDITTFRNLAAIYATLGKEEEARAATAEVLRLDPNFSIEREFKNMPWKDREGMEHYMDALRKAGLPETPPLPLPDKPSIAVLPFVNMSGDPEQEYFSDGISEQIITSLSKVSNLFVIARTSSFKYKGKEVDVRRVGGELGVRYVLEGSVQKSGDRVRITAQLIDAKSGNHVWAERYDRELKEIFALQDEIAMKVLTALRVTLTRGEQARIHAKGTNNLTAYLKFLKGHDYALRGNPGHNLMARQIFKEVIALDPQYPGAYSMLAWTHIFDISYGSSKSPGKSIKRATELVQKALALDDSLTPTLAALGRIYILKGQPEKALAEYERAVSLNPNAAGAHAHYGVALIYLGRPDEAIASFKKAIRLNPISPAWFLAGLAASYRVVGRYEESIAAYKRALDGTPDALQAHIGLTATYSMAGRLDEARAQAAEVLRVQPKFSLEPYSKRLRLKDKAAKDRYIDALRKAGLK